MSKILGTSQNKNFLRSQKSKVLGYDKLTFAHEIQSGQTMINLLGMIPPNGFSNPSPTLISAGLIASGKNLLLTNGEGRVMAQDIDYVLSGSNINFVEYVPSIGEIFYGIIDNIPRAPLVSLLDGVSISPKTTLDVGQTSVNIGRQVQIPVGEIAEPIIVMRNGSQLLYGVDYSFQDINTGYSQVIVLTDPGISQPGGDNVQIFANGFIIEKEPTGVNSKLSQLRGQINRIIDVVASNHGLTAADILLGAPVEEDLKFFGDQVLQNTNQLAALPQFDFGTYTPALTVISNLDGVSVLGTFKYTRVGSIVTVTGTVDVDPTAAGVYEFEVELPIASVIAAVAGALAGSGSRNADESVRVLQSGTNDRALVAGNAIDIGSSTTTISFTYEII